MSSFNVISTRQSQVVIDQAALVGMQTDLERRKADLERLRVALETLAQVNEPERFTAAAMALCNQMAARWKAERVGLGFLKGRYVRLAALSHTEKFTRQMRLVQDIEGAMEECLDQDVEILFPPPAEAAYVSRASETLATRHGPNVICNMPMRRKGEVVAVLTLERKGDKVFVLDEVETLRLTCDLVTPRLADLYEEDRWAGAKVAQWLRRGLAVLVGPKHTWIKATAIAISGFILFAVLVKGTYRVEAPFTFQAVEKKVISAPFDGFLKSVHATAGDWVLSHESAAKVRDAGEMAPGLPNPFGIGCLDSVLATMDTDELVDQRAESRAEKVSYERQRDQSMAEGKTGPAAVAQAQAEKSQATVDQLDSKIARSTIESPVDGQVFTGDLKQRIGAKLSIGDGLFEVGQPKPIFAELLLPEDDSGRISMGETGQLATSSYPGERVHFTVERMYPGAEVVKENNVFRVRVRIQEGETKSWMQPGMGGTAKVEVGRERYVWIWTHRLVNWVRLKLWM